MTITNIEVCELTEDKYIMTKYNKLEIAIDKDKLDKSQAGLAAASMCRVDQIVL